MKIPALLTFLLAALLAALPTRQARAEDVTFDVFYTSLADDGDWYNTPDFGYVWHPSIADDANWRPYTDGYWAQTDDGWTWVSYESFGWAAYHYGRWTRLKDIGWAWVPGYEWGPGWVSWRTSDDYVGWAPLPPRAERVSNNNGSAGGGGTALTVDYNDVEAADDGYTPAVDQDYDIGPDNYCFVATPQFGAPVLARVLLPPQRNIVIFENSRNVTNIYYRRGPERTVVYNSGPDFAFINGRVERPIQRLRLERRDDVGYLHESMRDGGNPTVVRNGSLLVAAPLIARRPVNFEQVRPVRVKQTIAQPQFVHGWSNAGGDPQQVERLREHIRTQAQAAPRQARADLPPQNVAPAPAPEANPRAGAPGQGQEEADRLARRDTAQREKAARDRVRNNPPATAGQPPSNGQNPGGENRGRNADERAARQTARDQARQAEAGRTNNPAAADTAVPAQDTRRANRQAREQLGQNPQTATPLTGSQPEADRAARRVERQQPAQVQPVPAAQPEHPDRDARRAERQQQSAAQPTQPAQSEHPDRDARRAERQQAQQSPPQTRPAPAPPEHTDRHTERQPAPPTAPQQGSDDDKKKKHDQ